MAAARLTLIEPEADIPARKALKPAATPPGDHAAEGGVEV